MSFKNTNVPLKARVNDDFSLHIDVGFSINGAIPKFSIKSKTGEIIDLWEYCTVVSDTAFIIGIDADLVKSLIGVITAPYDILIDKGNGKKEVLFSGVITVSDGVTL